MTRHRVATDFVGLLVEKFYVRSVPPLAADAIGCFVMHLLNTAWFKARPELAAARWQHCKLRWTALLECGPRCLSARMD